jgi:outer membrane protein
MATAPAWAELKIGYVNYQQLMTESPQAKAISDAIRAEFGPRQRELQTTQQSLKTREEALQKNAATMSDDQRTREEKTLRDSEREFQLKQQTAQDDFNARRNEELSRLQRTLIEEVRTYAKAQSFDLVLADGVIYANNAIDITPAILTQLKSASTSGGAAPGAATKGATTTKPATPPSH